MSEQYVAEVRAFGFQFAPVDWALCNGAPMSIAQNQTLYAVIGTTYGGDGVNTFNLPDLRDRTGAGMGQGAGLRSWPIGSVFGEANHTLLIGEVPRHQHSVTGGAGVAFGSELRTPDATAYFGRWDGRSYTTTANTTLNGAAVGTYGGSQPHENIQPVLVLNYCIALFGIFPQQG
jgi:microcystin-dependent protein